VRLAWATVVLLVVYFVLHAWNRVGLIVMFVAFFGLIAFDEWRGVRRHDKQTPA
jgi:hypothetical protein